MGPAELEQRCRFVYNHAGGRYGLTTDPAVARTAEALGLHVRSYRRGRRLPAEFEITFRDPAELELERARRSRGAA